MGERLVDLVLNATPEERTKIYLSLTDDEKYALSVILDAELENPWARFENDPVGFIEDRAQGKPFGLNSVRFLSRFEITREQQFPLVTRLEISLSGASRCMVDFSSPAWDCNCDYYCINFQTG
jgi:hypothetical protein